MDIELQPGDLLYMPRGTIHQGNCLEDTHSLHITVSCHQLNSYGDLLEKLLPAALKVAIEEDIDFRKGLPINYLSHLGVAHSDQSTKHREDFLKKIQTLMGKLVRYAPIGKYIYYLKIFMLHSVIPTHSTKNFRHFKFLKFFFAGLNVLKKRVFYKLLSYLGNSNKR